MLARFARQRGCRDRSSHRSHLSPTGGNRRIFVVDEPQTAMFGQRSESIHRRPEEIERLDRILSPISTVSSSFPPTLIVHGDEDRIVSLQQARTMDEALTKAGIKHKLEVVHGGGHDDKTFGPGLTKALRWFEETLLK